MSLLIIDAMNIIRRIHEAVPGEESEEKVADTLQSRPTRTFCNS